MTGDINGDEYPISIIGAIPKLIPGRKSNPPNDWMAKAQPRKARELSQTPAKTVAMPASAQTMTVPSCPKHSGAIKYRKANPMIASTGGLNGPTPWASPPFSRRRRK